MSNDLIIPVYSAIGSRLKKKLFNRSLSINRASIKDKLIEWRDENAAIKVISKTGKTTTTTKEEDVISSNSSWGCVTYGYWDWNFGLSHSPGKTTKQTKAVRDFMTGSWRYGTITREKPQQVLRHTHTHTAHKYTHRRFTSPRRRRSRQKTTRGISKNESLKTRPQKTKGDRRREKNRSKVFCCVSEWRVGYTWSSAHTWITRPRLVRSTQPLPIFLSLYLDSIYLGNK